MSPSCGCCGEWLKHLRANGFQVDANYVDEVPAADIIAFGRNGSRIFARH